MNKEFLKGFLLATSILSDFAATEHEHAQLASQPVKRGRKPGRVAKSTQGKRGRPRKLHSVSQLAG